MSKQLKKIDRSFIFVLPSIVGFMIFFIVPFFLSLIYAFKDKPVDGRFIGLNNFSELFSNPSYRLGLKNTVIFISLAVPITMILSLIAALQIKKMNKYRELLTLVFIVPLVIPSGSMVLFWQSFFKENGTLNSFFNNFVEVNTNWLDSSFTMMVIVGIYVWKFIGYNLVLFLSGLSSIAKEYYEAAHIDGATSRQIFFRLTLPNLMPTFLIVITMSIVNSFKIFKEIHLITGNYPNKSIYLLQHFMNNMFLSLNYPKLTTATSFLVLIISILVILLNHFERRLTN